MDLTIIDAEYTQARVINRGNVRAIASMNLENKKIASIFLENNRFKPKYKPKYRRKLQV